MLKGATSAAAAPPKPPAIRVQADDILRPGGSDLKPISGSDNPAFSDHLLNSVAAVLWFPADTPPEARSATATAALAAVHGFGPRAYAFPAFGDKPVAAVDTGGLARPPPSTPACGAPAPRCRAPRAPGAAPPHRP